MKRRDKILKSLKKNTSFILKEYDQMTSGFKEVEKRYWNLAHAIILKNFHERKNFHDNKYGKDNTFPKTVEEYILSMKEDFPKYNNFGHSLQVMINPETDIVKGLPTEKLAKLISEYVINYGEEKQVTRVDVIPTDEIDDYLDKQIFVCTDKFFEWAWDNAFDTIHRDRWGYSIKEKMWSEIQDDVESRIENQSEDDLVQFDDLNHEKGYFFTYWHYPKDNLGMDTWQMCDWYREYLPKSPSNYFLSYILNQGNYDIEEYPLWGRHYYFIKRNGLFE
jgi:hypothetical protein